MILFIDTIDNEEVEVRLNSGEQVLFSQKISAERKQGEKLLPAIEAALKKNKLSWQDVEAVEVKNSGGSFTSLRIGVATANALGFALGVPVRGTSGSAKKVGEISVVEPIYDREPNITVEHKSREA